MSVREKVAEFVNFLVGVENIKDQMKLVDDLGMAEEDVVELLMNLEEEYSLSELTPEEYYGINTVGDVVGLTETKVAALSEPPVEPVVVVDPAEPVQPEEPQAE